MTTAEPVASTGHSNLSDSISVFFPCHNEQDNVARVTDRALEVLGQLGVEFEIIIVNDGSTDKTAEIADGLAAEHDQVRVVHHPTNLGYGAALRSGFNAAGKELVFYTDGDGQFDVGELPPLLPLIDDYDIVSCYRSNRQDNFFRRANGRLWTKLVCVLFKMDVRDIDCAFKLYRREIFDHIEMVSSGALIDAEILARAVRAGYRITQRPVRHYPRTAGKQSGASIRVIFRAFIELLKLRKKINAERVN